MSETEREALARTIYEACSDADATWEQMAALGQDALYLRQADAILPLLAQVKATARAEAWDEGYRAGFASGDSGYIAGTNQRIVKYANPYRSLGGA